MAKRTVWEKTLLLSLFIHLVLVPYFSWVLGNQLFAKPEKEKEIELEMVTLPPREEIKTPEKKTSPPQKKVIPQEKKVETKAIPAPKRVTTPKESTPRPVNNSPLAKNTSTVTDRLAGSTPPSSHPLIISNKGGGGRDGEKSDNAPIPPRKIVYSPPQLLSKVEPAYPEGAREKGQEGTVVVRMEILESGQVGEVGIKKSSGNNDLDEAALKAVRKWRFMPAKDKDTGEPIKCFTSFPVVFRLT